MMIPIGFRCNGCGGLTHGLVVNPGVNPHPRVVVYNHHCYHCGEPVQCALYGLEIVNWSETFFGQTGPIDPNVNLEDQKPGMEGG